MQSILLQALNPREHPTRQPQCLHCVFCKGQIGREERELLALRNVFSEYVTEYSELFCQCHVSFALKYESSFLLCFFVGTNLLSHRNFNRLLHQTCGNIEKKNACFKIVVSNQSHTVHYYWLIFPIFIVYYQNSLQRIVLKIQMEN